MVFFLNRLRKTKNIEIRFVTNTTKESAQTLNDRLVRIGFHIKKEEIYSSLSAAAEYVAKENLQPYYILTDDARKDFPENLNESENAVVIGLAPEKFHYENLTKAFK